jgi:hypothetical protein
MPVTLVVAQEDVLAMHTAIILPPSLSLLNCLTLGMVVTFKWYLMLL